MKKITQAVSGYFATADKWLLFFWVGASALSLLFLWAIQTYWPQYYSIKMQLVATPLGIAVAIFVSLFDYRTLLKLWKLYAPLMVLLMLALFFFGKGRGDANENWLIVEIGSFELSIQPSEFLKIVFIMTFSLHLEKVRHEMNRLPVVALLCAHGGVCMVLTHRDTGSLLVFAAMFVTMLFCAGINWRFIAAGVAAAAAAVPLLWFKLLSEDQLMRIRVLFDPALDEKGYAWQQTYGLIALSMGGRQGTGLFAERHIYVPEIYNDMIFTFIGETSGFVGCLGVICLLSAIALKILYDSTRAKDDAGRFICVGVFAMIVAQMVINLGMCLRLLPVIGVTLPLFSSGGTSVLALYAGLGLVLSVYRHSAVSMFEKHN